MRVLHPDFQQLTLSQKFILAGVAILVLSIFLFGLYGEEYFSTASFLLINAGIILRWHILPNFTKNFLLSGIVAVLLSAIFAFFAGPPLHDFVDGNVLATLLIFGTLFVFSMMSIDHGMKKMKKESKTSDST